MNAPIVIGLLCASSFGQSSSPPSVPSIDRKFVERTIDSLATIIRREYVDGEKAARIHILLRQWLADGRYSAVATPEDLAIILTRDLLSETHDKHLSVIVRPSAPAGSLPLSPAEEYREDAAPHSNFGVQRVEILPGNVGYLNLTAFYKPEEARTTISAAMGVVAHADALIIDLRANNGGSPDTLALVASYFFDAVRLPLFEIIPRSGEGKKYVTEQTYLPERNGKRPIYVLTSEHTWSAGEGLAFLLQEQHRAEVIGEITAGAANPGRPYHVNLRFDVVVPNGRLKSAVLGRNWEGVGVVPDISKSATDALLAAHTRALRRLLDFGSRGSWRNEIEQELRVLEAQLRTR